MKIEIIELAVVIFIYLCFALMIFVCLVYVGTNQRKIHISHSRSIPTLKVV
ncbi:hypothetical protein RchiOBHm_Chr2g0148741 [Rosa chinensis]|uniref:Uncharacterized protein n=1 Tax=Rosa chinensis TaxID=74649 RepID=A0A2P6RZH4_ROSCH|nr:hypothetical protein RchiOBHm_Chr2g0148741 [Rosa chinensis]